MKYYKIINNHLYRRHYNDLNEPGGMVALSATLGNGATVGKNATVGSGAKVGNWATVGNWEHVEK